METAQLDLFYNTNHLTDDQHRSCIENARKQNGRILGFFRDNPSGFFTPFEVQYLANLKHIPITSIRRAMNTLTRGGYLVKTDRMKEGEYGAPNHTWKKA